MSAVLGVAIGIGFLYLVLALVVTVVQELIATVLRLRANALYDAIGGMLQGNIAIAPPAEEGASENPASRAPLSMPLVDVFYAHPLIKSLSADVQPPRKPSAARPSYIPSKTFALALLDVLRGERAFTDAVGATKVVEQASAAIEKIDNEDLRRLLRLLVREAELGGGQVDQQAHVISERLEGWFNDRMARASGWYKRRMQWWALGIAGCVTVATNADTCYVVRELWEDQALRDEIAASAQRFHTAQEASSVANATDGSAAGLSASTLVEQKPDSEQVVVKKTQQKGSSRSTADMLSDANSLREELREFPLGWPRAIEGPAAWASVGFGWIITALAVSLGAGFWFDVLGKFLQLRGSGKRVSAETGRLEQERA